MKEDLAYSLSLKCPGVSVVSISINGISYRNGMIIVHESVGGMPEFVEIIQMCMIKDELTFIKKKLLHGIMSIFRHLNWSQQWKSD